ncbi:MAG: Do family serine endopeptidase [Pseudomonadota bacterium]|nr:Do family serine endopeptidase [Pseudomonadota bacterium]
MKLNPLSAALLGAGIAVVGTAGAIDLAPGLLKRVTAETAAVVPAPLLLAQADSRIVPAQTIPSGQTPNYRAIVKQAAPAVVGINVEGTQKTGLEQRGGPESSDADPFFRFFGIPNPGQRGQRSPQMPFRGMGSGFIIGADGLILTNAHVVENAKDVTVKLSDRREFTAKVLGSDPATDIAVLKIDAKNLPVVRLGDPRSLEVGDPVLAIGAPYGLEQTATSGIVSAKGRSLPRGGSVPFIQTDAAVNPGNSGGPLFDGGGAVVGINSQIYSMSGGFQGVSFAIPINVALKVKDQIVATGKAAHGRLGVTVQDLNQSLADSFGMARIEGALVSNVAAGSAAEKAGIKSGDVITAVNGDPVLTNGQLSSLIGMSAPGDRVVLDVWRERASRKVEARLGGAEESAKVLAEAKASSDRSQLGLSLRPLTGQERKLAKVDGGLIVEEVDGAAARAGVEAGDVLLAINGKPVQSLEQVKSVLATKPKSVALLVQRDGEKIFVPVKLG